MDRTVPTSGNEDIILYIRTYYSLLRSSRAVKIRSLVEAHKRTNSALHVDAQKATPDMSALLYSILRLPDQLVTETDLVIMGQSEWVFAQNGYPNIEDWEPVSAPARRRRAYWDGENTLALYIASRSDIDDIIPKLTAFQIERDKLHTLLNQPIVLDCLQAAVANSEPLDDVAWQKISKCAGVSLDDLHKLAGVWGEKTAERLLHIAQVDHSLSVRLMAGSFAEYKRATRRWWDNIRTEVPEIEFYNRPIYFISSNTHSIANLLSGYSQGIEQELTDFVQSSGAESLKQEYHDIVENNVPSSLDNFLYYILRSYEKQNRGSVAAREAQERSAGIHRVASKHVFDIEAQVIELSKLDPQQFDPRLQDGELAQLAQSDALIINIDYPLGMAAYQILSEIARNIAKIRGIYIMGKAATLNGRIGDVMIPRVVHDEHSANTYLFQNQITADDIAPYLVHSMVLDNQKAITAPGTFLQNHDYMSVFYKEGYTDLEMEAGPYLSCVYEIVRPRRYPQNEIVTLHQAPFPIGVVHYASDTPFSKGMNLGAQTLSYFGMDPTYATTIAIMKAIFAEELKYVE